MIKLLVCAVLLAGFAAVVYVLNRVPQLDEACASAEAAAGCDGRSMPPNGLAFLQRRPN